MQPPFDLALSDTIFFFFSFGGGGGGGGVGMPPRSPNFKNPMLYNIANIGHLISKRMETGEHTK